MGLVLVKTIEEMSRKEIEEKLSFARMKRMQAAVELQQMERKRLSAEATKVSKRLDRQLGLLGKDLKKLDDQVMKVQDRLNVCDGLTNELEFVEDYS